VPTGRVSWFDPKQGVGRVVASGREYPVVAADMETRARATSARVHFDVTRQDGVDRAVNVRRVPGTRSVPRQRRFQDLTGAGRPEEKGRGALTRQHPERDATPTKPKAVVTRWIKAANSRSVVATRDLYAVDVVLHAEEETRRGRAAVAGWLLDHNLLTPGWEPEPHGQGSGETFTVTRRPGAAVSGRSRIRVSRGQISEQWLDEP
jgi:cold shock CspA family protein